MFIVQLYFRKTRHYEIAHHHYFNSVHFYCNNKDYSGWEGPYLEREPISPWGSGYWLSSLDLEGNGAPYELGVVLTSKDPIDFSDIDRPVPVSSLTKIDTLLDEGDLAAGNFRRNSAFGNNAGVLFYYSKDE